MNKTLGSTLITSGTMIGAGMLAMPLTSAGIGFTFTVVLLVLLWILLTYSALLFVEVYQTAEYDAGIGTLAAQYFGRPGRIIATSVLMIFLYALLSAYVTGGGAILASTLPDFATPDLKMKGSILAFTIFFGIFVAIGTSFVDALNRFLFITMIAALFIVLGLMIPEIKIDNLMAMPIDKALLISASPVFFTAFGFHGSIPCLNKYLEGDVKALRFSIIMGSAITLVGYLLWQFSTHGVLSQSRFLEILNQDPTLNGLIEAVRVITGSTIIAAVVKTAIANGQFKSMDDLNDFIGQMGVYFNPQQLAQINKEFDEYANGTGKYSPNMKGMKSSIESLAGRKIDGVEWQGVSAAVYPKVQEFREKNGYDPSPAQMAQWGAEEVAQQAIASTKTGEFWGAGKMANFFGGKGAAVKYTNAQLAANGMYGLYNTTGDDGQPYYVYKDSNGEEHTITPEELAERLGQ